MKVDRKELKTEKINGNSIKNTTFVPQQLWDNCCRKSPIFRKFCPTRPWHQKTIMSLHALREIPRTFACFAPHALKGQKLLAQGIALGYYGRKPVAL